MPQPEPSARIKYVVVAVGVTVIVGHVTTIVPGQEPEYQFQTAPTPNAPPTFESVMAPPQDGLGLAVAAVGVIDTGV